MSKLSINGEKEHKENALCPNKVSNSYKTMTTPIRLKDVSHLRKLGENGARLCRECHQRKCACLWCKTIKSGLKGGQPFVNSPRDDRLLKSCNVGSTSLRKFRHGYNKHTNNLPMHPLDCHDSVVWIMRPIEQMRVSKTNIRATQLKLNYLTAAKEKYSQNLGMPLNNKMLCYHTEMLIGYDTDMEEMAKTTKDYYNERHRKLSEIIDVHATTKTAQDGQKKHLYKSDSPLELASGLMDEDEDVSMEHLETCKMPAKTNAKEHNFKSRQTRSLRSKADTDPAYNSASFKNGEPVQMFDDDLQRIDGKQYRGRSIDSLESLELKETETIATVCSTRSSTCYNIYGQARKVTEKDVQTQTSNHNLSLSSRSIQLQKTSVETPEHQHTPTETTQPNSTEQNSYNEQTVGDNNQCTLKSDMGKSSSDASHYYSASQTTFQSASENSDCCLDEPFYNNTSRTTFVSIRENSNYRLDQAHQQQCNCYKGNISESNVRAKCMAYLEQQCSFNDKQFSLTNAEDKPKHNIEWQAEKTLKKERMMHRSSGRQQNIKSKNAARNGQVEKSKIAQNEKCSLTKLKPLTVPSSAKSKITAASKFSFAANMPKKLSAIAIDKKAKILNKTRKSKKRKLVKNKSPLRASKCKSFVKICKSSRSLIKKVPIADSMKPETIIQVHSYNVIQAAGNANNIKSKTKLKQRATEATNEKTSKHTIRKTLDAEKEDLVPVSTEPQIKVKQVKIRSVSAFDSVISTLPNVGCTISFHTPVSLKMLKAHIKCR